MVLQIGMKLEDMQKILRISILNVLKGRISVKEEYLSTEAWKSASREYLKQIHINTERVLFKTFKGFRLFAGDGSDFDLLEIEELRKKI